MMQGSGRARSSTCYGHDGLGLPSEHAGCASPDARGSPAPSWCHPHLQPENTSPQVSPQSQPVTLQTKVAEPEPAATQAAGSPGGAEPMATQAVAPPQPSATLVCLTGARADMELTLRVEPGARMYLGSSAPDADAKFGVLMRRNDIGISRNNGSIEYDQNKGMQLHRNTTHRGFLFG